MADDVEKRWNDPRMFRRAAMYAAVVVAAGAVTCGIYVGMDRHSIGWAVATPAVVFLGSVGAFVQTYRTWRARRAWPIWQGAGWFLMAVALLSLSIPAMGLAGGSA